MIALAVYNFVLFFPVLFMGRVVSPNDVFYNMDPWAMYRPDSVFSVQNSLLNDPPTAYLTLMSMLKDAPETFHWNPYVGSGIPGFGSSAAAVLSPFILFPVLLLPLTWVYTAIIFLKLNLAFYFAYLWLREERLGKWGAAAGALVAAGAGPLAIRWLWQLTNAAALYPLLLLLVRRAWNGKRTPVWITTLALVAYALAGFPAAMAYGVYVVVLYAIFLIVRTRRVPLLRIGEGLFSAALALLITAPSLVPLIQLVRRSGYLAAREQASFTLFFPPSHWLAFLQPERWGNPAFRNWIGDPALGSLNNFVDATIYLGALTLLLVAASLFNRRARGRFFWAAFTAVVVMTMFGLAGTPHWIGPLPGVRYSSLIRLSLILPVVAAPLVAAGASLLARSLGRRRNAAATVALVIAVIVAGDLALFAGRFHPYMVRDDADVPTTPTIEYLKKQPGPFRIAPTFNYLWPNSAELFRLEDIRSHFGSEARYRQLMQRIDPTAWAGRSTVIQFNSLKFDVKDPAVGMLGVRYILEQRTIDILKWGTFAATVPGVRQTGSMLMPPKVIALRTVHVDAEPFYAIELPASVGRVFAAKPRLEVTLMKQGKILWSRRLLDSDLNVMQKVYIPLRPYARLGDFVTLRVRAIGMSVWLGQGEFHRGEAPLFYGRVTSPVIFDRELPDGRLFLNLAELPRFHAVSAVRSMSDEEFLATKVIDFASEAALTGSGVQTAETFTSAAKVELRSWKPGEQRVLVDSPEPMFLASAEKLTPELAIAIDGRNAKPVEINMVFAGVRVPAGKHEVVFTRRIGRGWWWPAGGAAAVLLLVTLAELFAARRRG